MDVKVEAPKHDNQVRLIEFYTQKLNEKYSMYPFVKSIDVKVTQPNDGLTKVALQLKPEKGTMLFASHEDENENRALMAAIKSMNIQIEKYKQKHYHTRFSLNK